MAAFNKHLLLLFRRGCPATDLEDEAKALAWLAVVEDMLVSGESPFRRKPLLILDPSTPSVSTMGVPLVGSTKVSHPW